MRRLAEGASNAIADVTRGFRPALHELQLLSKFLRNPSWILD
jgi:hypothetical protein